MGSKFLSQNQLNDLPGFSSLLCVAFTPTPDCSRSEFPGLKDLWFVVFQLDWKTKNINWYNFLHSFPGFG